MAISGKGPIPEGVCRERLKGAGFYGMWLCGRPVKEDGKCGVHLAVARRRAEKAVAREERWAVAAANRKVARDLAEELKALGVDARGGSWAVELTPEGAHELIVRLRGVS